MAKDNYTQRQDEASGSIEDLTLKEIEAENVKGGPGFVSGSFGFGVEREMKES